ncbi:MAG: PA2778 family cysteine peptidase [Gammaproteobacteria bacterium]|nr:PA2778 family cysteine peptidase [Gammaproteobacteria bacterium]
MSQAAGSGLVETKRRAGLVPALFAAALGGCALIPGGTPPAGIGTGVVELVDTPFFPQERYQCGPAALMTVLTDSGTQTSLDALVDQVYLPGRQGSLQAELVAATRAAGRIPYQLDGSIGAIRTELEAGRPVLVLQNLGVSWYERWHYAVVVGVNPEKSQVVLRSGTESRHITDAQTFMRTWRRSDSWALIVLRPGELPTNPDQHRYYQALSALEETGHFGEARGGWQAALERWPGDTVALFGMANTELALDNSPAAESLYRQLLTQDPSSPAVRNNLAHALAQQGKKTEAMEQIGLALDGISDDEPMRLELEDSLREIQGGGYH